MAYREVTMIEITEVLRQRLGGARRKQIARRLGLDPKTVRRYLRTAERTGLRPGLDATALTEERRAAILTARRGTSARAYGDTGPRGVEHREFIATPLRAGGRLAKVRRLRARQGVALAPATRYRFATAALGWGRTAATIAVADGGPGEALAVDTGGRTLLAPDERGRRRRFRAWIFTPRVSRYRFVFPCFAETTASAIAAWEAAWAFSGGVFKVRVPDNTQGIIQTADPLQPHVVPAFLEYAPARGFVIDPARGRRPTDKARCERSVPDVRDDCFGGERLATLEQARVRAVVWCREEAGRRRHRRTLRRPREHFAAVEQPVLLPAPTTPYDVPRWSDPLVARDHDAQGAKALYALPTRFSGRTLRARADQPTVRFYDRATLVKTPPRKGPGERSTDPADFPAETTPYALRAVAFLAREAARHGAALGTFARALLAVPLPWTRMRRVYALLGLVKRDGAARVEEVCQLALAADLLDGTRLTRMRALAAPPAPSAPPARVIPLGRYLRPARDSTLPRPRDDGDGR